MDTMYSVLCKRKKVVRRENLVYQVEWRYSLYGGPSPSEPVMYNRQRIQPLQFNYLFPYSVLFYNILGGWAFTILL
jgi:hypothetical protein